MKQYEKGTNNYNCIYTYYMLVSNIFCKCKFDSGLSVFVFYKFNSSLQCYDYGI